MRSASTTRPLGGALRLLARVVLLTGDGAALRTCSGRCLRQWQRSLSDRRSLSKVMEQTQAPVPRILRTKPRPKRTLPQTERLMLSYVRVRQANLRLPCFDLTFHQPQRVLSCVEPSTRYSKHSYHCDPRVRLATQHCSESESCGDARVF